MTVTLEVREQVLANLKQIESDNDVQILFAVESGSRAWGFSSPNSDYDIRFVYKRCRSDYLSLGHDKSQDVIEKMAEGDLDFSGWDIRKALKLASCSNPSLAEWARSPICYRGRDFQDSLARITSQCYSIDTAVRAYFSMAKGNHTKYIKDRETVVYKRYLYVLRPLLVVRWILRNQEPPPVLFDFLIDGGLPLSFRNEVTGLIELKRSGAELGKGSRLRAIDEFIDNRINNPPGPRPQFCPNETSIPMLDSFLFSVI